MLTSLSYLALFVTAFAGMEGVAYLTHRYAMHGPLWFVHRSHHRPRERWFELNDLFGVFFAVPSMALIYLGARDYPHLLSLGLGMTAYGVAYFVFHDGIVHQRIRIRRLPRSDYLSRITRAHLIHHKTTERDGATSFGFLYAPRPSRQSPVPSPHPPSAH